MENINDTDSEVITVYFETPNGSYAEVVALFTNEDVYSACLPHLEAEAAKHRMIVTESVE